MDGENYVSFDELVRHALTKPHSRTFDYLALFAFHFSRMGRRVGTAGDSRGARFANEFVCNQLWNGGGWSSAALTDTNVEAAFTGSIIAAGDDTVHKCVTNYMFMLEVCGLRNQRTPFINAHTDEWAGPAFFLAFDRICLDKASGTTLSDAQLVAAVKRREIHKLMGTTEEYVDAVAPVLAHEYTLLGGLLRRLSTTATATVAAGVTPAPTWTDEDAEDLASIAHRLQEVQAQIRNSRHVRELKHLYQNTCCFCGKQTIVGVGPDKFYSEAAHIKPVGKPHGGPDTKSNMIILCSEHHLQLDRGVLSLRKDAAQFRIVSKVPGDLLHQKAINAISPHALDASNVLWHSAWWR